MKKTLIFLTLFASVSLFAQSESKEKSFKSTMETKASPQEAWNTITDVAQWKHWDDRIVDVRFPGPLKEKGTGQLITDDARVVEFKVTELEDVRMYTFKHKLSSGVVYTKRMVMASDTGSSISEEVWFKGISRKTFEKYCGTDYTAQIAQKLERLKAMVEK